VSTWPTEIALLRELVATPSISGSEAEVAELVETTARGWGLDVVRDATGVKIEIARGAGPTLALVSHLDVVPPGHGWTRDPWTPTIEGDLLYGRGSGDAKASVASMLAAARDVARAGGAARGRLICIFGYNEETRDTTMGEAVASVGAIDAALVGEPTNLQFAVAQRGLMMVDLVARGDQRHAAYADRRDFTNAAQALAEDLLRLGAIARDRPHAVLGHPTITPTMLEAGISRNVTPPMARAVLDIRSTPSWPHDELAAELRRALGSEVVVTSDRLVPCETPAGSRLLDVLARVRPESAPYGSPTCSDWVFLRHTDTVKCGPGTSLRSHTPDECVDLPEVTAARAFYAAAAAEYLS
jgi:acetylornithine deacetylase